ncbi:MAG: major facilitator superfamily 1, partial [Dehalococcoidia bacterium]|nr:major facilitator superfamily 1 [Dehalococcoidia bacterium]
MQPSQPQATSPAALPGRTFATTFDPLRKHRGFRLFWASGFFFFSGTGIQALVMAWLVYDLTHSTYLLGIYTAVNLLPQLLGPLGGLAAERLDRVRLLLVSQALSIVSCLVVAALAASGLLAYWHLIVAGFVLGVTGSTMMPARSTLVMDLVSRSELSAAMALNNVAMMSHQAVGPLIGGNVLRHLGVEEALICAALGSAVAAAFLARVKVEGPAAQRSSLSPLRGLVEGFQMVLKHRTMLLVLLVTFLCNVFGWPAFQTFMPVFAKDVLKVGPDGLGLMQTTFGLGALVGAVTIASLGDFQYKGKLYLFGTAAFGLCYALFAMSHWFPLSLGLLLLGGMAGSCFGVMQQTLLLVLAPSEFRGRVMGVMMLAIGVMPLSSFTLGAIAGVVGAQPTATFCGFA